jgi:RNA polymerase sigma factor (sigma-70 family)
MLPTHANPILRHVRRLVTGREADAPDRDLLQSYLDKQDSTAFAELVERHGPMVLGVCQAVLHHTHDAEDAFQATFLVLARHARSIRRRDGLGSWLHGVAHRVSLKARAAGVRRRAVETKAPAPTPVCLADELTWGEVRAILHAELAALPERLGEPLVLCYLEGLTQEEAAEHLGWTPATLKGRLQRGRDRLRRRLERRGLARAVTLGAAVLTGQSLAAPLTPALADAAMRVVSSVPGQTVSSAAAALARGVVGTPVPGKFWLLATMLVAGVAVAGTATLFPERSRPKDPMPVAPPVADRETARTDRYGDPLPDAAVARLGTVRYNHADGLNALHFSPDGQTIISDGEGHLCLWDAATGKPLRQFSRSNSSLIDPTVLLPDGKTMVFLIIGQGITDAVQIWDLDKGQEKWATPLPVFRARSPDRFPWSALSRDGRLAAVRNAPQHIRVFEIEPGKDPYELPKVDKDIEAFVFAGTDRLVTADKNGEIDVWEARTGKRVRGFANGSPVGTLAASTDGRWLATVRHNSHVVNPPADKDLLRVWDLTTGAQKHALAAPPDSRWGEAIQFAPDGKLLYASGGSANRNTLTVWDVATGERIRELPGAGGRILAVSPDGQRLASAGYWGEGNYNLWDVATGRRLSFEESRHALTPAIRLSRTGDRIVSAGYSSISTWETTTGGRLNSVDLPPRSSPISKISPDSRYAATLTGDGAARQLVIWDIVTRQVLHRWPMPMATNTSYVSMAFSPDSSTLVTWLAGKESDLRLWDVRTGKEIRSFKQTTVHPRQPVRLNFTADGKTLSIADWIHQCHFIALDLSSGKELSSWQLDPLPKSGYGWRSWAVSPDGALGACLRGGDTSDGKPAQGRVTLCDAKTGKVLRRWSDSGIGARHFEQMAFSPDGRLLASSDRNVVHLWEVATGNGVYAFRGHQGDIMSLSFSANGRRLASSSTDSTVLVWDFGMALGVAESLPRVPGDKEMAEWWADLARTDARRAYAAILRLAQNADKSIPFLGRHLKPAPDSETMQIRQHLKDLDAEAFATREQALLELERLGPAAAVELRRGLAEKPSLEARRRMEQLLEKLDSRPMTSEPLRTVRTLAALESSGTKDAQRLLRELAGGAAGSWLTREAKASLERLASRKDP